MLSRLRLPLIAALGWVVVPTSAASAHGLQVVGRKDVPVPDWLFAWGGSIVLILSFLVLAFAWRRPLFDEAPWRAFPGWIGGLLGSGFIRVICGAVGVLLLLLVLWSGFDGVQVASENFAPSFVFVTFWLGLVPLSLLFGDVFKAFNPWFAIGRAFEASFEFIAKQKRPALLSYPSWLGRWPAAAGLLGFIWFELVYGFAREGVSPEQIAVATVAYSLITLVGIIAFGTRTWIERGEAFSVFFGMIATLSPIASRGGRPGIQPPVIGAKDWRGLPGSIALVCVSIGGTIYDGALESVLSSPMRWLSDRMLDLGFDFTMSLRVGGTILLLGCIAIVAAVYWIGVAGMHKVAGSPRARSLGRLFAHALIPIAVAYFVAHYFSLFFFVEQAQFTYLLSDPLGHGWDLFGTADGSIDYSSLSATATWYVQVGALVVGHVIGLVLAHERALKIYSDPRAALRSQYWMLAVMVVFTTLGLFLLSESNQ